MVSNEYTKINPLDHPIILSYPDRLVEPAAWIQQIPFAKFLINELKPDFFIELGTQSGNPFFLGS